MKNYKILAELRKKSKLKAKEVADKLNFDHSTISCYERGKAEPSIDVLAKLAEIYDVNLEYLVNGKGETLILNEEEIDLLFKFLNVLTKFCSTLKQRKENIKND